MEESSKPGATLSRKISGSRIHRAAGAAPIARRLIWTQIFTFQIPNSEFRFSKIVAAAGFPAHTPAWQIIVPITKTDLFMETKPQLANVSLLHPAQYFATYMVNRLNVEKHTGFLIGHFGLMDDSGKLLDSVGFIFTDTMLKELRENLVSYSTKIETANTKSPVWNPIVKPIMEEKDGFGVSRYGVVDFIHLTNWEDAYAEICFWSYPPHRKQRLNAQC